MKLQYKGAAVHIRHVGGVWVCQYSGPLCRTASLTMGRYARGVTGGDPVVDDIHDAVIAVDDPFTQEELGYLRGTPPGAIVCGDYQRDVMLRFCAALAGMGVVRSVFGDAVAATRWLTCFASRPVSAASDFGIAVQTPPRPAYLSGPATGPAQAHAATWRGPSGQPLC